MRTFSDLLGVLTSPVGDYLRDPWGVVQAVLAHLREWASTWGPLVAPAVAVPVGALVLVRWCWQRRCQQRWHTDARVITVLAPPTVDPAGAMALWSNLVGLLRPAWARWISGQPHVVWEYVFSPEGVRIQLWVPGVVPPGMVERAIEAAWPGAHTRTRPAEPPLPVTTSPGQRVEMVGGELRLARSEALPIKLDFPTDPIRALLGAPVGLGPQERAVVQILARPITGARVNKARRAARQVRAGQSIHLAGRLLDLITPHTPSRRRTRPSSTVDHQISLEAAAQDRVIITKHRGSQYETRVRYAISTLVDDQLDPRELARVRAQLRGRAHAIAAAFAAFTDHNYYRRTRLHQPVRVLAARRLHTGDLLSVPELAALAHLPTDEAIPGLQRAGAKAVPPPPGIASTGADIKPIGCTDSGHPRPVGLYVSDARHHLHILGATGSGNTTPHLRHTYRVTTRHGVSLRRGRRSARFAVASKACLIDHRGCVTSGLGSRDHRNALFCR